MAKPQSKSVLSQLQDDPRKGTFTLAMGSVVIVIFMIVVAIRPAVTSVIKQVSSNKERAELITGQNEKLQNLKKLIDDQNSYSTEIELFKEAYPKHDDAEFVVRNIYEYVDEVSDLELTSMRFDYAARPDGVSGVSDVEIFELKLQYNCDIDQAVNFIRFLESMPRIIDIDDISLSSNEDTEETLLPLSGNVSLEIYQSPGQTEQII